MKKVLLLLLAIFSISIAASAKQQVISDGFDYDYNQTGTTLYLATGTQTFDNGNKWYAYNPNISSTTATVIYHTKNTAYLISGKRSIYFNNSGNAADRSYVVLYTPIKTNGVITIKAKSYGSSNKMRGGIYKMNPTFNAAGTTITSCTVGDALVTFPETIVSNVTTYTVNVEASEENPVYIGLSSNGAVLDDFTFTAILPNTVSGTITNTNGETISGATVDLLKDGKVAYTTTSGENGKYTFGEPVPNGTYTLRVTAAGYKVYTAESATDISDDTYNLDAEIVPLPTWSFGGQVTGDNGSAIGDLSVTLVDCKNNTFNAITGNDGKFEISGVTEGKVTLTINSESLGYKPFEKEYTVEQDRTDYTFELENYTLSGSVLEKGSDKAIEGAKVVLKQGDTEVSSVTTGADGTFSFGGLKEGDYTLTASADGFVTESDNISLNGGADVDKQFVLEWSKSTISGTVVRNDVDVDAALAGIVVELLAGETVEKETTSAADGAYSFEIKGALADAGYKLHVAATDYFQEFTADVTPEYQGSVIESIGLDTVMLEYVAVIENEDGEALEGAAITVAKAAPKQIIDSFEYLANYSGAAKEGLLANGWLAVSVSGSLSPDRNAAYQKDGQWSLKMANISDYYCIIVRAAKAGTVSIWTLQDSYAGQVIAYKMKDNGDGTYAIDGSALASKTTSANWSQLSFTLDKDCLIGFKIKGSYVDYYVNESGATAAPAYAAPALAEESGDTPSNIKITKDPIDLKTFTIAIPKVDYSDETYTATASATGATLLTDPSSSTDVWDFTFSDEKHVSVFTGGTPTGVSDISVDSAPDADAEYFTLQGVRVTNPHSGIYICRRGSATSKVLIR